MRRLSGRFARKKKENGSIRFGRSKKKEAMSASNTVETNTVETCGKLPSSPSSSERSRESVRENYLQVITAAEMSDNLPYQNPKVDKALEEDDAGSASSVYTDDGSHADPLQQKLDSFPSQEHSDRHKAYFDSPTSSTSSMIKEEVEKDSREAHDIFDINQDDDSDKEKITLVEYFSSSVNFDDTNAEFLQQGDHQLESNEDVIPDEQYKEHRPPGSDCTTDEIETSNQIIEKESAAGDSNYERRLESQLNAIHGVIGQRKAEIARKRQLLAQNRASDSKNLVNQHSVESEQLKKQLEEAQDEIIRLKSQRQLVGLNSLESGECRNSLQRTNKETKNSHVEELSNQSSKLEELENLYQESKARVEALHLDRETYVAKAQGLEVQLTDAMSELTKYKNIIPEEERDKVETEREFCDLQPAPSDDTSTFLEFYTLPLNRMEQSQNLQLQSKNDYPSREFECLGSYETELEEHYRQMVEQWEEAEIQRAALEDSKWLREQKLAGLQVMYTESRKIVSVLADESQTLEGKGVGTFDTASTEGSNPVSESVYRKTHKKNKQMKKSIKRLSNGLETANSKLFELLDEIEKSQSKENFLRQEIRKLTQGKEKLWKELSKSNAVLASVTAIRMNSSREADEGLQNELARAQNKSESLEKDLDCEKMKYESELSRLNQELEDSQIKISTLETQFSRFIRKEPVAGLETFTGDRQLQHEANIAEFDNSAVEVNDSKVEELMAQISEKDDELRRKEESHLMQDDQIEELRERLHTSLTTISDLEFELRFNSAKIQELSQLNNMEEDDDIGVNLYEKSMKCAELETKLNEAESKLVKYQEIIDRLEQERSSNKNKVAELSTVWDSQAQIDAMRKELQTKALVIADHLNASLGRIEELESERNEYKNEAASSNMKLTESMRRIEELQSKLGDHVEMNEKENEILQQNSTDNPAIDGNIEDSKQTTPLSTTTMKNGSFTDISSALEEQR
eukprot:CAMPEP_0194218938 /NCGR_PEP_ID=MMETSP0156-20130528/24860_1 /TAXON_ID=33649 /ORGANISM="Thalassionema nitzschioides, Strain L26-B" /LENGTH=974 /DNA_ID=CAMNT_0038948453 /DNA_START=78 /DNA_END=3002 /DNA_ORIENTATION=+